MRDYSRFEQYLDDLRGDVYSQPQDSGHTAWAKAAIEWWHPSGKVLDVGCGSGFCKVIFDEYGVKYTGITLSPNDIRIAHESDASINIRLADMTFLPYDGSSFDAIFSRHVLEHSPFPIITLMEWRRVAEQLMLIAPSPQFWGWYGKNHYSITNEEQLWWWLRRAGWRIVKEKYFKTTDKIFVENYSDNLRRIKDGEPLIDHPGTPKVVEYWMLCERTELIKE